MGSEAWEGPSARGRGSAGLPLRCFWDGEGRLDGRGAVALPVEATTPGSEGVRWDAPFLDLDLDPEVPFAWRDAFTPDVPALEFAAPPATDGALLRGSPAGSPLLAFAALDASFASPDAFLTFPLLWLLFLFSCFFLRYSISGVTTTAGFPSEGEGRSVTWETPVLGKAAFSSSKPWRNCW